MISKSEIKKLRSLNSKKGRILHELVIIEGKRIFEEALRANAVTGKVWITNQFKLNNSKFINIIEAKKSIIDLISNDQLKKITNTKSPSGIIGTAHIPNRTLNKINYPSIILDDISDPGNLGTILRSANWFGLKNIFLSNKCVDPYNLKVIRSAMGAHFSIRIIIDDLEAIIRNMQSQKIKIIAADLNTDKIISDLKISSNKWSLLLGNEAHGISKSLLDLSDYKFKIPQIGKIESLNVSVACSIFLYHIAIINKG